MDSRAEEVKEEVKPTPAENFKKVIEELNSLGELLLSPVKVYYANRALSGQFVPIHEYTVVATNFYNYSKSSKTFYLGFEWHLSREKIKVPDSFEPTSYCFPLSPDEKVCLGDRKAFEKQTGYSVVLDSIKATHVYEVFQEQLTCLQYVKSQVEEKNEDRVNRIAKRLVFFNMFPAADNAFSANCNKATATFLQEAEDRSAKQGFRPKKTITGRSPLSIYSVHRMFLWNSGRQRMLLDLFINRTELTTHDFARATALLANTEQLNKLAHDKKYILDVIATWPVNQEIMALEQIMNPETPLGVVFSTPQNPLTSYLPAAVSTPNTSRGLLGVAAERLEKLKKEQGSALAPPNA